MPSFIGLDGTPYDVDYQEGDVIGDISHSMSEVAGPEFQNAILTTEEYPGGIDINREVHTLGDQQIFVTTPPQFATSVERTMEKAMLRTRAQLARQDIHPDDPNAPNLSEINTRMRKLEEDDRRDIQEQNRIQRLQLLKESRGRRRLIRQNEREAREARVARRQAREEREQRRQERRQSIQRTASSMFNKITSVFKSN